MSSAGQAIGYVVGAIAGYFTGGASYVLLGAAIGGAIGSALDPPKGPNIVGPRLSDRRVQVASYGYQLPRLYGTMEGAGCVFWVEGDSLAEHEHKKRQGGKGGSKSTSTTYTYSATFGVALAQCAVRAKAGVRRIKIAGQLVYDANSTDVDSIIASNLQHGGTFKFYDGRDDQEPDPRMQADKGINNVSGHPGLCWLAIYDLDLTEKYGNTLAAAQVQVEIVCEDSGSAVTQVVQVNADTSTSARHLGSVTFQTNKTDYSVFVTDTFYAITTDVELWSGYFGESQELVSSISTGISPGNICRQIPVCQSSEVCALLQVCPGSPYDTESRLWLFNSDGAAVIGPIDVADFPIYKDKTAAIDDRDWFIASREGVEIYKFTDGAIVAKTSATYEILSIGLSESFVFGVKFESSNTSTITVYKFDRSTLALLDTFTGSGNSIQVTIHVLDDDTFYTALTGGTVLKWSSGSITNNLGVLVSSSFNSSANVLPGWFSVFSEFPPYVVSTSNYSGLSSYIFIGHANNPRTPIKLRTLITEECSLVGLDSSDLVLTGLVDSDVRGYAVAATGAVRGGLEPLQAAFPFDVTQSGYSVKFISRGGSSVANIAESDLGAHASSDSHPALLTDSRETSEQLPASTTVVYFDADREYDNGEQTIFQPGITGVSERRLELAIVMTPDEAAQTADVLTKKQRAERDALAFVLPPTWKHLEPADVVTINHRSREIECRLISIEYLPDGRLECRAVPTSVASYSTVATGSPPTVMGQTSVPLRGTTKAVLLDIPRIVIDQDASGISAALYGQASGWPGGILMRSDDGGQTWPSMTGFADKSEVFTAVDVLGSGRTDIVDASNSVTVTPNWSAADLYSITELQMFAGGNLAAFGADGRWEIIAFRTVVDNTGSYTLSDFMRGRYGTEWASSLHQIGDQLIMLTTTDTDFIGLPLTALNSSRIWRAVTNNDDITSAPDITYAYSGVNLKPLSSVYVSGDIDSTSHDWHITWVPRSRVLVDPFSGLDTPIGEASEKYDVEIWDSAYTTLKRTITGLTSPEADYSSADQVSDFGAEQSTLYLKIYKISADVGRGYPAIASISMFFSVDPFAASVKLFAPLTADFDDVFGHTITASGAVISGGYALFDGVDDYVYLDGASDIAPGTSDFTFEARVTPLSLSRPVRVCDYRPNTANGAYVAIYITTTGYVALMVNGSEQITSSAGLCSVNVEYCIEVCRSAGTSRLFVDGALIGSWSDATNYITDTDRPFIVGNGADPSNSVHRGNAKVRWLRYTAAARHTSAHTPDALPLPDPTI